MARNLTVIFWALLLGQMVGFIGSALTSTSYSPAMTAVFSVVFALLLNFVPMLADKVPEEKQTESTTKS